MFSAWSIARELSSMQIISTTTIALILLCKLVQSQPKPAGAVEPQQCGNGFVLFSYYSDSVSCTNYGNVVYSCKVSKCFTAMSSTGQFGKPYKDNFIFKNCHRIDASDHPTKSTVTVVAAEFVADNGNGKLEAHGTPPGQKGRREYVCYWSKTDNFNNHRPWCTDCSLY
ncbi:hypothetical protein MJO28_012378 [Puccinia striiformis f. sp. tritici]|uniref:Secreted protein n=2 Tax=Puccinia striiformis TaxID=27350 RepID=A0A2S4WFP0_9BASI|nr:hypothetical protein Pst134EA_022733 [Puccinia striiformis f. sp. tritici]KAH9455259.1 hypothetical protein Pst134EA_022733 [Puccinia striiformis f. sp. tritici]KAI7942351.1 hypothetical protein MJO28_012378 [Puccinia striiformis f. sp. tritici]POW20594.1 hypothetical protein PSHT_03355 [Puccinia striiformis]